MFWSELGQGQVWQVLRLALLISLKYNTSMHKTHACIAKCATLLPFLQLRNGRGFNR
jgi:hypothetical protein